ncbi:MAG: hypothetical protein RR574_00960, partial [Comamonas sp.]
MAYLFFPSIAARTPRLATISAARSDLGLAGSLGPSESNLPVLSIDLTKTIRYTNITNKSKVNPTL